MPAFKDLTCCSAASIACGGSRCASTGLARQGTAGHGMAWLGKAGRGRYAQTEDDIEMSKLFLGGMPTGPDLRKLADAIGVPVVGQNISHQEVEDCLGHKRDSNRYRTVTTHWRRDLLRDHDVDLEAVPGVGFRVMSAAERVSTGKKGVQQGTRKVLRSITRADLVRTEDPQLQKAQEVLRRYGAAVRFEANRVMREIEPPKPQEQKPRLVGGSKG